MLRTQTRLHVGRRSRLPVFTAAIKHGYARGTGAARHGSHVSAHDPSVATPAAPPDLLTVDEAAAFLRVTPKAARGMIDRGQMPGLVRIGGRLRIRSADLRKSVGLPGRPSVLQAAPSSGSAERR